jgi:hypothetical protein
MLLEITLKILAGYVSASRVWLSEKAHALNCMTSATPESGLHLSNQERDELRIALTAAQESSIIQLLLEICLPTSEDRKVPHESIKCLFEYLIYTGVIVIRTSTDKSQRNTMFNMFISSSGE